jgi:3D (Asp-Asp-Asp) domain-containing protein
MTSLKLSDFNDIGDFLEAVRTERRGYSTKDMFSAFIYIGSWLCIFLLIILFLFIGQARAEEWMATGYCQGPCCCGKYADGYFASGKKVYVGGVAVNWLPFGTPIFINRKKYIVEDRGAKSIFGTKKNPKKRVDIFFDNHKKALLFGKRKVDVQI